MQNAFKQSAERRERENSLSYRVFTLGPARDERRGGDAVSDPFLYAHNAARPWHLLYLLRSEILDAKRVLAECTLRESLSGSRSERGARQTAHRFSARTKSCRDALSLLILAP